LTRETERERNEQMAGKEGPECTMRRQRHEHMCNERDRERKERGEILIEDGREIRWMKEI
jgi:hypothetical protein